MNKVVGYTFLIISFFLFSFFYSCKKKERIITDSSAKLDISVDTVLFDTVFTTIGSTTRRFTIRNRNNQKIIVSRIQLSGGTSSQFRINVDGVSGVDIRDIEINENDSAFVFVEVTVDPNNGTSPMVASDQINFITNGNTQKVELVAWGQDAYFHYYEPLIGDVTWTNDKPHVIYGIAAMGYPGYDSGNTLTILPGTKIYGHNNAVLYVYKSSIEILGDLNNPVIFQGDRLEEDYDSIGGQWFGIRMFQPSESNINYTNIINATAGIWIDTVEGTSSVNLKSVRSLRNSYASFVGQGARVNAENCLFGDAGNYSGLFNIGGEYNFNHCTFANFWSNSNRSTTLFVMTNWFQDIYGNINYRPFTDVRFTNCIFYGNSEEEEMLIDLIPSSPDPYLFDHCIIKTVLDLSDISHFNTIKKNQDPQFEDTQIQDYHLKSNSPAMDEGNTSFPTSNGLDIEGIVRTPPSDIGCFEYQ